MIDSLKRKLRIIIGWFLIAALFIGLVIVLSKYYVN